MGGEIRRDWLKWREDMGIELVIFRIIWIVMNKQSLSEQRKRIIQDSLAMFLN